MGHRAINARKATTVRITAAAKESKKREEIKSDSHVQE
jgi:hypothetical protein